MGRILSPQILSLPTMGYVESSHNARSSSIKGLKLNRPRNLEFLRDNFLYFHETWLKKSCESSFYLQYESES